MPTVDPGSGWDVAGTTNATANHTLTRKNTISGPNTDWAILLVQTKLHLNGLYQIDSGWDSLGSYTGLALLL